MASFLDFLLDLASRPGNAIRSGVVHGPEAVVPGLQGNIRTDATELPGVNSLPDQGLSVGPVNLTPRTVAGFGASTLLDPLTYLFTARAPRARGLSVEPYRGPELSRQGGVTSEHFNRLGQDIHSGPLATERRTPETGGATNPRERGPIELGREPTDYPIEGGPSGQAPMTPEQQLREYVLERGPAADVAPGRTTDMKPLAGGIDGDVRMLTPYFDQGPAPSAQHAPALSPEVSRAAGRYDRAVRDAYMQHVDPETGELFYDAIDQAQVRPRRDDLINAYSQAPGRNPYTLEDVEAERVRNALYSTTRVGTREYPPIVDRMRGGRFSDYTDRPPADLFLDSGELNPVHEQFALDSAKAYLQRNMRDFEGSVGRTYDNKGRQVERFRQEGLMRRSPGPETGTHTRPMLSPEEMEQSAGSGAMRTVSEQIEYGSPDRYGNELHEEFRRQGFNAQDEAARAERRRVGYAGDDAMGLADAPEPMSKSRTLQFASQADAVQYRDAFERVRHNNELIAQLQNAARNGDETAGVWARKLYEENDQLHRKMDLLVKNKPAGDPGAVSDVLPDAPDAAAADFATDAEGNAVRLFNSREEALLSRGGKDDAAVARARADSLRNLTGMVQRTRSQLERTKYGKFQQHATKKKG